MNQEGVLASCAVCNKQTQRRCGRCYNVYYCNTEHQRQDWKKHKIICAPKLQVQGPGNVKITEKLTSQEESKKVLEKEEIINTSVSSNNKEELIKVGSEVRRLKKYKKKIVLEGSDVTNNKNTSQIIENSSKNTVSTNKVDIGEKSVFSSVVYSNKDTNKISAITHEGSSEQEILNEKAQQLSSVDFAAASTPNVLKTNNRTDIKMPPIPIEQSTRIKEYPEASLKGSVAPFNNMLNSYYMDPSDPSYDICQRVITDMTQYGVCAINNFLGKERGLLVLKEVLEMYRSGIFTAGQLVSSPGSTEARTIRSDRITWIDGKESQCTHIGQLINQVDSIILKANKMANNGKMGNYNINGRTKAMVACYPGSGSHYVKHVDNPNKDGRCITAIYYLNLDWDVKRCGGLLRVFPEGTNQVADIEPIFDRMLFFWSDRRNPHEVQPAYATRYAITLWYFDSQEREEALRNFTSVTKRRLMDIFSKLMRFIEEQELSEESLQSEFKLPYFKVCLFATVLEDAITKLRILEECNTELKLKKISSDMITLLAHKHHVEPMPVKDELDQIDPKRLGCLEYTLKKLEADRAFTIKVLKDTYINLTTMRQFDCLSHSVVETKERRQRFHLLMEEEAKNKWLYRDICRQLRQLRNHIKSVTYDKNNVIEILKSSVQDAELNSSAHSRYVTGWQRARSEQHAQTITDREAAPTANIELYKTKIDQEQHVHSEVELLFNIKIQEVLEKVEGWMKKYEKDMENIELKIQRKKNEHDITYERRLKLEETIEKHVALMKNWVTFKEEREAARLYREKMFHSAVTIQAWWRGLLVRNQLGPYKIGKKRGPAPKSAEKSKKKK